MIKLNKPSDCCGCTACASVCSHNAITMKPDALGFLYPVVDKNKCVDCGLCEAICPFNEHYDTSLNFEVPIVYGARHKDINEVMQSRSGAVFVAISDLYWTVVALFMAFATQVNSKSYINVRIIKSNAMNFEVANMCRVI